MASNERIMTVSRSKDKVIVTVREIGRNQYTERRMTLCHAKTLVTYSGNDHETEALAMQKLEELNIEKQSIKNKAKQYFYLEMQRKASQIGMKYKNSSGDVLPVSNYKDIALSWKQDHSDKNAQNMYELMYGQFEKRSPYWRSELEIELMHDLNLKYNAEENDEISNNTGCISKLITAAKTEVVKTMNSVGKNFHGRSIGIANKRGSGKKKKRRKMGEFMQCFLKGTRNNDQECDFKVRTAYMLLF